jgi:uncharacterized membrane protein YeaQ/YmgE (transglycosylase-associated protein family)
MLLTIASIFLTGLLIGSMAHLLVPGDRPRGIVRTAGIGIVGSLGGGLVLTVLVGTAGGLLGAVAGAVVVIWIGAMRRSRSAAPATTT